MTPIVLQTSFHSKADQRAAFWKVFVDWLATAADSDVDQLEQALAPHAHHVRPVQLALMDAISDQATALLVPNRLTAALRSADLIPHVDASSSLAA